MISSVALIGLGEVGQILATDLYQAGIRDIASYDILFANSASSPARARVSVAKSGSTAEAVRGRDLVISAVTAASDGAAAEACAPFLRPSALYLDLNSVSPGQKQAAAKLINGSGGRYIEAAVMTPFPPKRIASPMLLGGPYGKDFLSSVSGLGFSTSIFSEEYGPASATKMCRSVVIKGLESLLIESLITARNYGVESTVLASLSDLLPVGDWNKLASYRISRSLEHGKRRAEEMREAARTVEEAGVAPLMSDACAQRQEWAAQFAGLIHNPPGGLRAVLDSILAAQNPLRKTSYDH